MHILSSRGQIIDARTDVAGLDALHWDETVSQYLDWGLHTEGVKLQRHSFNVNGQAQVCCFQAHYVRLLFGAVWFTKKIHGLQWCCLRSGVCSREQTLFRVWHGLAACALCAQVNELLL